MCFIIYWFYFIQTTCKYLETRGEQLLREQRKRNYKNKWFFKIVYIINRCTQSRSWGSQYTTQHTWAVVSSPDTDLGFNSCCVSLETTGTPMTINALLMLHKLVDKNFMFTTYKTLINWKWKRTLVITGNTTKEWWQKQNVHVFHYILVVFPLD